MSPSLTWSMRYTGGAATAPEADQRERQERSQDARRGESLTARERRRQRGPAAHLFSQATPVGFANSGGLIFVDESAEKIATA